MPINSQPSSCLFDVPFGADKEYIAFLQRNRDRLHSIHFAIDTPTIVNSRSQRSADMATLLRGIEALAGPKKYALINSRFYQPAIYLDKEHIKLIIDQLAILQGKNCLDGIIFCDHYLLHALSKASPETCQRLEAVPGINSQLDTVEKIESRLDSIGGSHFLAPGKLILDRSLNRNVKQLAEITHYTKTTMPQLTVGLLANEGCLWQCPFKLSHDAQISLANCEDTDQTHAINSEFGCINMLRSHPERLFKSPFIRPEDLHHYHPFISLIKICGRTLGPHFLIKTIRAYRQGSYTGNLLSLMDAMHWLSQYIHVDNQNSPSKFWQQLSQCRQRCRTCTYCTNLLSRHGHCLPLQLPDYR